KLSALLFERRRVMVRTVNTAVNVLDCSLNTTLEACKSLNCVALTNQGSLVFLLSDLRCREPALSLLYSVLCLLCGILCSTQSQTGFCLRSASSICILFGNPLSFCGAFGAISIGFCESRGRL